MDLPVPRWLPCPTCHHDHSFLPCDDCLCTAGGQLIGIDTALGG